MSIAVASEGYNNSETQLAPNPYETVIFSELLRLMVVSSMAVPDARMSGPQGES